MNVHLTLARHNLFAGKIRIKIIKASNESFTDSPVMGWMKRFTSKRVSSHHHVPQNFFKPGAFAAGLKFETEAPFRCAYVYNRVRDIQLKFAADSHLNWPRRASQSTRSLLRPIFHPRTSSFNAPVTSEITEASCLRWSNEPCIIVRCAVHCHGLCSSLPPTVRP